MPRLVKRFLVAFSFNLPSKFAMPIFAPAQLPDSNRRADIQGLRAIAVLLVIIFHAGLPLAGGFAGVDVFFVISGFVITSMLLVELESGQGLNLKKFYLRRIRRLLPALATTSICTAAIAMLANPIGTQITTALTGMATSLFVANGYLYRSAPGYFSPGAEFNPMLHTWSLSVEEQFYFVFPLVLLLSWRVAGASARTPTRRWTAATLILAMLCLSFLFSCAMSYGRPLLPGISAPTQFAFYASPTRAWEFAAGALLAFASPWLKKFPGPVTLAASIFGLALMTWSALLIDGSMRFPGWVAWVPVAATLLLIIGGSARVNPLTRLFSSRVAVWIGDRSYGWYLWHWPFVVFGRALFPDSATALVIASALSIIPAWASYRFIETPLRSVKHPSNRATWGLAAICIIAPMVAFGALLLANRAIVASPGALQIGTALQLHIDEVRHCEGSKPLSGLQEDCTWPSNPARGSVLLLGDSNAGHFTEPVIAAAHAAGYGVTVATLAACPFVDLQTFSNGVPNDRCQAFVATALVEIEKRRPNLIILATATDSYIEEPSTSLRANPQSALAQSPAEKAKLWRVGLSSLLARMTRSAPVLLVHPIPRFRTWTLSSCAAYKVWLDPMSCAGTTLRSEVDAWRARALQSERAAMANNSAVRALELADTLCPLPSCTVIQGDTWIFRDGAHLSVPGSLTLTNEFETAIRSQGRSD
jgi:peptidoglycan/LPS O-acetylase OafA/YrhL